MQTLFGQPSKMPSTSRELNGWAMSPALGVDGVKLTVRVDYFSSTYTADVLAISENSVIVRFRGAKGQVYVQRVEILPTLTRRAADGNHRVMLTPKALDAAVRYVSAFTSFADLLDTAKSYRPTLLGAGLYALVAKAYDAAMVARTDPRRAYVRPLSRRSFQRVAQLRSAVN